MTSYFCILTAFLDDEKFCINCLDPGTKKAKTASIVSADHKWAQLEQEYLHSDWTYETNI